MTQGKPMTKGDYNITEAQSEIRTECVPSPGIVQTKPIIL